jgi:hypothetical protein
MMDFWHSDGLIHTIEYWAVDAKSLANTRRVENITVGGKINHDQLTALKVRASVPYIGKWELESEYLRIISRSTLGDRTETVVQGTFVTNAPNYQLHGGVLIEGEAQCVSLLQILQSQMVSESFTVDAKTNAVACACQIINDLGLKVSADSSSYMLNSPAVFGGGSGSSSVTMLDVVNTLMSYAGFSSADVAGDGTVLLRRYTNPAEQTPVIVFVDDESSIIGADSIRVDFDKSSVPNVFIAVCNNSSGCSTAVARNDDPRSPYSTVTVGREIHMKETVSDVASTDALQALADRRLDEVSMAVEQVTFAHAFIPYRVNDALALRLGRGGFERHLGSVSLEITLNGSLDCLASGRRLVR